MKRAEQLFEEFVDAIQTASDDRALNVTRSAANARDAFAARRHGSLALLSTCREFFAVPHIAIGEYEPALLQNRLAASEQ